MTELVLSLFPGIGLLDMAFEEEGFCVVRGPDVLWGGDIRRFHPPADRFQGVIGGPPCQCFSTVANLVRARGYEPRFGNLIPEFERVVQEAGVDWFLMENVPAAPEPCISGLAVHSFMWNNAWIPGEDGFGEEQSRKRRFSFGVRGEDLVDIRRWLPQAAFELPKGGTVTQYTPDNSQEAKRRVQRPTVCSMTRYKLAEACRLQGLPEDFLGDAPFTQQGKMKAVANGVPLSMGRAVAHAVKEAIGG